MQHCSESVKAFEKLPKSERRAFVDELVLAEQKDTLKALLITCVRMHSWSCLSSALQNPAIRAVLWSVIDDMLIIAHHDGKMIDICKVLPSPLSSKEGGLALVFPCRLALWPLTQALINKGAVPGSETFRRAFTAYESRSKTPFEFNLVTAAMGMPEFNWRELLSFPELATAMDLIKRSATSSKPGYQACAFALMKDEQKANFVEGLFEKEELGKIYPHISLTGSWMQYLSVAAKSKILSDDMGI